jgi:hypothetical protein
MIEWDSIPPGHLLEIESSISKSRWTIYKIDKVHYQDIEHLGSDKYDAFDIFPAGDGQESMETMWDDVDGTYYIICDHGMVEDYESFKQDLKDGS